MKNKAIVVIRTLFLSFLLLSCQEYQPKNTQKLKKKLAINMNIKSSKFSGNFSGVNNAKEIFVVLNSTISSNKITGVLTMDGEQAKINATEKNGSCSGTITESNSNKLYAITISFVEDAMHFAITFPEYDHQVLTLILTKSTVPSAVKAEKNNKALSPKLIGTWRFTEVLSSGSGEFYASFSTDYFVQFKSNGQCSTWTGKSAGGTNDATIENDSKSNVDEAQWYTVGNNVVFVNPSTNKEMSIPFYAEENKMMLKGNLNRVYTRIN